MTRANAASRGRSLLAVAVFCVSTGAICARRAESPALVVALWRCGLATLVLAGLSAGTPQKAQGGLPWRAAWGAPLLCGALLATHFALWIHSLDLTSVAASVFLVSTTPLWVALLSTRVTGESVGSRGWLGLIIGLAGTLVIATAPSNLGEVGVLGSALAVGGAVAMAAYALVARRVRGQLPLTSFLLRVHTSATAVLAVLVCAAGVSPVPIHGSAATWLVAGALIPQVLGHSSINAALRSVPAALVSLALLGEPILSTLWAWLLLEEPVAASTLLGGALVLGGIGVAASPTRGEVAAPPS